VAQLEEDGLQGLQGAGFWTPEQLAAG